MKARAKLVSVTLVLALGFGCATSEGTNQATGAAIGGLAGGLICTAAGGNAGVCVASAAGGALLGWGAVKAKQVMDRRSELAQTSAAPSVVIRDYQLQPAVLAPGQALTANTTYDLMTPSSVGPRAVTQTFRILTADGKEVNSFTPVQGQMKEHGRYDVGIEIPIPKQAPPGNYQLVQTLDAQTARPEVRIATFQVVKRVSENRAAPDWRG